MRFLITVLGLAILLSGVCYSDQPMPAVGVAEFEVFDGARQRSIKLRVWYPKEDSKPCVDAQICLSANTRRDQTVLLMHGAMGSVRSHNWLGYAMAGQGFVSVGIDHFGESWSYGVDTLEPSSVLKLGLRPADVSFVLNQLSDNVLPGSATAFASLPLQWQNVSAVGHSSGGMAAFLLAGAKVDTQAAFNYCQTAAAGADLSCRYFTKPLPDVTAIESHFDSRIKRIIALDPAGGHLLTKVSLQTFTIPVMVVGSQQNDFLPFTRHAAYYAEAIEGAELVSLNRGEGHFVYLDECDHQYEAMGISLCKDRNGLSRKDVHASLYPKIFRFLYSNSSE